MRRQLVSDTVLLVCCSFFVVVFPTADPAAREEFDQWVLPAFKTAMLKMMQGRLMGGVEHGGPAERLARLLADEARAFQTAQPRGAIIPSIPHEVSGCARESTCHLVWVTRSSRQ
jgi:hypothetical protein